MINFKASAITLHIIGWLFFLSLPVFFIIGQNGAYNTAIIFNNLIYCTGFIIYIIIFYLHTYILLPSLFLKKRFVPYFLSLIFFFLAVAYLKPFDSVVNRHTTTIDNFGGPPRDIPPPRHEPGPPPGGMPPPGFRQHPIACLDQDKRKNL